MSATTETPTVTVNKSWNANKGVPGRFRQPALKDVEVVINSPEFALFGDEVSYIKGIDPMFRVSAELLGQAVVDAAHALRNGAVDKNLIPYGGRLRRTTPSSVAKCSILEAVDACRFLTNGTAARVLEDMERVAGSFYFHPDFLLRKVRELAGVKNFHPRKRDNDAPNQARAFSRLRRFGRYE